MIRLPLVLSCLALVMINVALVGSSYASLMHIDAGDPISASPDTAEKTPFEKPSDQEEVFVDWDLCPITGNLEAATSSTGTAFVTCTCSIGAKHENDDRFHALCVREIHFVPPTYLRGLIRPPQHYV